MLFRPQKVSALRLGQGPLPALHYCTRLSEKFQRRGELKMVSRIIVACCAAVAFATIPMTVASAFADKADDLASMCTGDGCEGLSDQCRAIVSTLNTIGIGQKITVEDLTACGSGFQAWSVVSKSKNIIGVKSKTSNNVWVKLLNAGGTLGNCYSRSGGVVAAGVSTDECL